MAEQPVTDDGLDEEAVAAFARRLSDYAKDLSPRDRQLLNTIVARAMDPIERMRWRHAADLLSPAEEATLRALLAEHPGR